MHSIFLPNRIDPGIFDAAARRETPPVAADDRSTTPNDSAKQTDRTVPHPAAPAARPLPLETVLVLKALCSDLGILGRHVWHPVTGTAKETQAVLPKGCLVQKTVTGKMAGKLLLWTGVSDFRVAGSHRKQVARRIGLNSAAARNHTFNPAEIEPAPFFGMAEGAVNPFLIPGTPALLGLTAVVHLPWPADWEGAFDVAISISLEESLIVPLSGLRQLLWNYAAETYSHIPLISLGGEAQPRAEESTSRLRTNPGLRPH